ncbi:hypothetical protein CSW59_07235 [Caulobacter sp. BP25]|nr:hypothetical protein CSW59_07235 [Caulobacter sp. BP25]
MTGNAMDDEAPTYWAVALDDARDKEGLSAEHFRQDWARFGRAYLPNTTYDTLSVRVVRLLLGVSERPLALRSTI